ncbi:class I SAM-dependent methyltransferase [Dictyobacter kobayashii]|uniref:Methyltransferase domain-containing protein n=1 Tax=Dictyobacter kobayashii TaxID=2014872 RepID=A0A402AT75_9CHLR|nr:class I SAM-dependent methyltransferase [Dictyobacter kobayashii]GCE22243.1 hypothetical protein KDK_60430 [Dictyobacter kobayashii]
MGILLHLFHRKRKTRSTQLVPRSPVVTIEGRIHRRDVPYLLPKDTQETHRLDFQHFGLKLLLGGNYKAPIDPTRTHSILDVGSGTGRWIAEMAQEFPQAHIYGIDTDTPAPHIQFPPQCHFSKSDILKGLPYVDSSFYYVHQRLLVGGIPTYQWPAILQELIRVTQSDGWIELLETGNVYHNTGPATKQLQAWWDEGMTTHGFDLSIMPTIDALLTNHGLINVHMEKIQVPLGAWAGRPGDLLGIDIFEVFKSFKGVYVDKLGIKPELFDQVVALLPEEWEHHHTTYEFYSVFGQKP